MKRIIFAILLVAMLVGISLRSTVLPASAQSSTYLKVRLFQDTDRDSVKDATEVWVNYNGHKLEGWFDQGTPSVRQEWIQSNGWAFFGSIPTPNLVDMQVITGGGGIYCLYYGGTEYGVHTFYVSSGAGSPFEITYGVNVCV